jgi:spore coat polysaccharide biosynthesis protein SpsF
MIYNCLLTVRTASSRLKNKCLLPFGNYNFIEHSIKRCLNFNLQPIVCTTSLRNDNLICAIAKKYSVKFFRGSSNNKIKRWYDCANYFKLNNFHIIDVDDPFFDDKSVKKSLEFLKKYDLVLPSNKSRAGGGSEGYSVKIEVLEKILSKLNRKKINNMNIEIVDNFFKSKKFNFFILPNAKYETYSNFRVTLDYQEDYFFLNIIRQQLGNFAGRVKINNFLDKNKFLKKINFFRNDEWKKRQMQQIKKI